MKRIFKLFACVGLVSLLLSSAIMGLFPQTAHAQVDAKFVDRSLVILNNQEYIDRNPFDGTDQYVYAHDGCQDDFTINSGDFDSGHSSGTNQLVATVHYRRSFNSNCVDNGSDRVILSNTGARWTQAYLVSNDQIFVPQALNYHHENVGDPYGPHKFKKNKPGDTVFLLVNDDGSLNGFDNGGERIDQIDGSGHGRYQLNDCGFGSCATTTHGIQLANNGKVTTPDPSLYPGAASTSSTNAPGQANGTNGGSCEAKGGALSWFICPVIELLDSAVNALDGAIQSQLKTPDTDAVQGGSNCGTGNCLKDTWGRLRNVALIILVPIMLIMVIGTAIGYSGLDAYTVKRAVPRLLIAVIFISVSWYLTSFLIKLTNVVGAGTYGILTQPFGLQDKSLADMVSAGSGFVLSNGLIFGGIIAGLAGAISIPIILSLAVSAALALFIGFCILVLRNVFIFAMVLLAPLAILAWIFPNNDKLWKLWWDTFSKLLLMYPMVMALIAAGKIFASIIPYQQGGGGGLFTNAAIIIAYIAPYFLIPATFKFAGGAFANIAGMLNDRGRGAFDRLKEGRQKQRAHNFEQAINDRRFKPNSLLGRNLNKGIQAGLLTATGKAGFNPRKLGANVRSVSGIMATAEMRKLAEENQDITAVSVDDSLAESVKYDKTRADIENRLIKTGRFGQQGSRELSEAVSLVERAQKAGSATAVAGAMVIARAQSGTGYKTVADMHEAILDAAEGNRQVEGALLAATRSASERARRPDLAGAGHVKQAEAMDVLRATRGVGGQAHADARDEVNAAMRAEAFEQQGAYAILNGRPAAVQDMITGLGEDFDKAVAKGDTTQAVEVGSQIAAVRNSMSGAPPAVRKQIADMMAKSGLDINSTQTIDAQLGARISGYDIDTGVAVQGAYAPGNDPQLVKQRGDALSAEIRNRAGLFEQGGRGRTTSDAELAEQGYTAQQIAEMRQREAAQAQNDQQNQNR